MGRKRWTYVPLLAPRIGSPILCFRFRNLLQSLLFSCAWHNGCALRTLNNFRTIAEVTRSSRRIWFVNRFFWPDHSATSQIVSDLAFHLAGSGHDVGVITSRGLYDEPDAVLPKYEMRDGVSIHRVADPHFGRANLGGRAIDYLAMYHGFAMAVWRLAWRGDVVVVKTDPPLLSCAIAPITRARGLFQVNWLQDLYPEVALGLGVKALKPFAPLLVAARDISLRLSGHNIAISEAMARRLVASRVAPERISIIPNWCDDDAIHPVPRDENPLREAWGLRDKFVVGYSGNLGRAHECGTLLDAAELLRGDPRIVFLFIGGGHQVEALKREVERRSLTAVFQFRPYQPASALSQSLSLPDVHWISLRPEMEGLIVPSKFFGVAAAGRPVIAVSAIDGEISGLVMRHVCGVHVAPGDGNGLAAAISELKGDPERLRRLGENARAMLEMHMTREQALGMWEAQLAPKIERRPVDLDDQPIDIQASNRLGQSTPASW